MAVLPVTTGMLLCNFQLTSYYFYFIVIFYVRLSGCNGNKECQKALSFSKMVLSSCCNQCLSKALSRGRIPISYHQRWRSDVIVSVTVTRRCVSRRQARCFRSWSVRWATWRTSASCLRSAWRRRRPTATRRRTSPTTTRRPTTCSGSSRRSGRTTYVSGQHT